MFYESISSIKNENNESNSNAVGKQFEISLRYNENEQEWESFKDSDDEDQTITICYKVIKAKPKTLEIYKTLRLVSKPFMALALLLVVIFFFSRTELFLPFIRSSNNG